MGIEDTIAKGFTKLAERMLKAWFADAAKNLDKVAEAHAKRLEQQAKDLEKQAAGKQKAAPKKRKKRRIPTKAEQVELAYRYLGVHKGDPEKLIKDVYRAKAKSLHPDKDTGSKLAFQRLEAAYKLVLDDLKKRGGK